MPSSRPEKVVPLGRVGRPFGNKGWLHFYPFNACFSVESQAERFFLSGDPEHFFPLAAKPHGKEWVIQLPDLTCRYQAQTYTQQTLCTLRHLLPELPEGEYYYCDLIGFTVKDKDRVLGVVLSMENYGGQDLMRVTHDDQTMLIPFHEPILQSVDFADEVIIVQWHGG